MSVFKDCNGDEWRVYFDAFTLTDAKKETGIDLADIAGGGWQQIESDATAVVRVLSVLCADEIKARKMTARDFSKRMRGEAIGSGREALLTEAADFFPPSEWSAIRGNLKKRTATRAQMEAATTAIPLMEAFSRLPKETQDKLLASGGATGSEKSEGSGSASGQIATLPSSVTDAPENAGWTAVG